MLHPVCPRNRLMYTQTFPSLRVGSGNETIPLSVWPASIVELATWWLCQFLLLCWTRVSECYIYFLVRVFSSFAPITKVWVMCLKIAEIEFIPKSTSTFLPVRNGMTWCDLQFCDPNRSVHFMRWETNIILQSHGLFENKPPPQSGPCLLGVGGGGVMVLVGQDVRQTLKNVTNLREICWPSSQSSSYSCWKEPIQRVQLSSSGSYTSFSTYF